MIFPCGLPASAVLVLVLRRYAGVWGLLDHPAGRKQHAAATPTVGGLAMFLAVVLALWVGDGLSDKIQVLIGCAFFLMMVGMLDDRRGLPVKLRLMLQIFYRCW